MVKLGTAGPPEVAHIVLHSHLFHYSVGYHLVSDDQGSDARAVGSEWLGEADCGVPSDLCDPSYEFLFTYRHLAYRNHLGLDYAGSDIGFGCPLVAKFAK